MLEMLKFARDNFKTNKSCKYAAKKLPCLLGYVDDQ